MQDKRIAAVPTAQCWLDAGLERTLSESDRWHGLMNAYNHTENALFAARKQIKRLAEQCDELAAQTVPIAPSEKDQGEPGGAG